MKNTNLILTISLLLLISCKKSTQSTPAVASGCTTCKIFSTAGVHGANFGGVAGADAVCAVDSNLPSGGGTYKALIAASNRHPPATDWPLKPSTLYVQKNGTVIGTTTSGAVLDFPLTNNFGATGTFHWTGLTSTWGISTDTCSDWTSSNGALNGEVGNDSSTSSSSIANGTNQCGGNQIIYCVEQ